MTPEQALEAFLYEEIALSKALGVTVRVASESEVRLVLPLEPNLNHCQTAFGGSASAAAILAAFSLLHVRVAKDPSPPNLIIASNHMRYLRPVESSFEAYAWAPDPSVWERFRAGLLRKGKGRIHLQSQVLAGGEVCGEFSGDFVALRDG